MLLWKEMFYQYFQFHLSNKRKEKETLLLWLSEQSWFCCYTILIRDNQRATRWGHGAPSARIIWKYSCILTYVLIFLAVIDMSVTKVNLLCVNPNEVTVIILGYLNRVSMNCIFYDLMDKCSSPSLLNNNKICIFLNGANAVIIKLELKLLDWDSKKVIPWYKGVEVFSPLFVWLSLGFHQ